MLVVSIPLSESYDEEAKKFVVSDSVDLKLEHSLVSLSKWESFFEKPFLGKTDKSTEETLWYVEAMILNPEIPDGILQRLTEANIESINTYVNAKMTATTIRDLAPQKPSREIITSEIIYYWMIALNIPVEFQYWHLNRLLTLIKVCNIKSSPPKKMSKNEARRQQSQLNAQRRARLGTSG